MRGLRNKERKPEIKTVVGQWGHGSKLARPGGLLPEGLRDGDAWTFGSPLLADRGMTDLSGISSTLERSQRRQVAYNRGRIRV